MRAILAGACLLAWGTAAFAADPAGRYAVTGTNPEGGAYSGEVAVQKTGDTYRVDWSINGERFTGTGIGSGDFLAVSYVSGGNSGLALYIPDRAGWRGLWTYSLGRKLGTEVWVRQ